MMNNEIEVEEFEIINYITASKKVLKKNRLLLDDNDPRILLEEGANIYEYKY